MSALQEISGHSFWRSGSHAIGPTGDALPFPGNTAYAGIAPSPSHNHHAGRITEFCRQSHFPQSVEIFRKPPRPEGTAAAILAQAQDLFRTSHQHSNNEVEQLKTMYRFQNEVSVEAFLSRHRSAGLVLINALPQLQASFGRDVVFNLEAIKEDDEEQVLYAVAVWRGPVEGAVASLHNFDENWWLDQPTRTLALTFTYELA